MMRYIERFRGKRIISAFARKFGTVFMPNLSFRARAIVSCLIDKQYVIDLNPGTCKSEGRWLQKGSLRYSIHINTLFSNLEYPSSIKQVGETIFCGVGINLHSKWGTDVIDKLANQLNDITALKCIMGYKKKFYV